MLLYFHLLVLVPEGLGSAVALDEVDLRLFPMRLLNCLSLGALDLLRFAFLILLDQLFGERRLLSEYLRVINRGSLRFGLLRELGPHLDGKSAAQHRMESEIKIVGLCGFDGGNEVGRKVGVFRVD